MGHQFSFFWSDQETLETLELLAEIEALALIAWRSDTSEPNILTIKDLSDLRAAPRGGFLARKPTVTQIMMSFVEAQGYWCLDIDKNPVIEFTRNFLKEDKLRIGRFYYTSSYFESNDHFVKKDEAFLKWVRKVFSRTKARFEYDKELFAYVGKDIRRKCDDEGLTLTYM